MYMLWEVYCIYHCIHTLYNEYLFSLDENESGDYETLVLTVEALKAQLEEQTRLCKDQVKILQYSGSTCNL